MITEYNFEWAFHVHHIKDHEIHKPILMSMIDELPNEGFQNVTKTDWNLPIDAERKYLDYFVKEILMDVLKTMARTLATNVATPDNVWVHQYGDLSASEMHTHPGTNYSACYFLELPDPSYKSVMINPMTGKEMEYDAKEGDLIIFPAVLPHCSKPMPKGKRKTIIGFNCDFSIEHHDLKYLYGDKIRSKKDD